MQPIAPHTVINNNNNSNVLNNNNLNGSPCEQPDPDFIKMFVGQVPKSMDEDQLREMFEEFGRVHSINVLRDKVTGVSKGNWIRFCRNLDVFSFVGSTIGRKIRCAHFYPVSFYQSSLSFPHEPSIISFSLSMQFSPGNGFGVCANMYFYFLFARKFYLQFLPVIIYLCILGNRIQSFSHPILACSFIVLIIVWRTDFSSLSNFAKLSVKQTCIHSTCQFLWTYEFIKVHSCFAL